MIRNRKDRELLLRAVSELIPRGMEDQHAAPHIAEALDCPIEQAAELVRRILKRRPDIYRSGRLERIPRQRSTKQRPREIGARVIRRSS